MCGIPPVTLVKSPFARVTMVQELVKCAVADQVGTRVSMLLDTSRPLLYRRGR